MLLPILYMLVRVRVSESSINVSSDLTSSANSANRNRQSNKPGRHQPTATETTDLAISSARRLQEYKGELAGDQLEDGWFYTTGPTLNLYAPKKRAEVTTAEAVKNVANVRVQPHHAADCGIRMSPSQRTCQDWRQNKNYWITSTDSRLASRTGNEAIDAIRHCAILMIQQTGEPRNIRIHQYKDCNNSSVKALPMCLKELDNPVAQQSGYRDMQEEVKTLIINGTIVENLEQIKEELNNLVLTTQEDEVVGDITGQIDENIEEILQLEEAHLPEFEKIKDEWVTATTKVRELQTIVRLMKIWKDAAKDIHVNILADLAKQRAEEVTPMTPRTRARSPPTLVPVPPPAPAMEEKVIKTERGGTEDDEDNDDDNDNGNNEESGSGSGDGIEEEEGIRQLTRYEKAVAWANLIMKALETLV